MAGHERILLAARNSAGLLLVTVAGVFLARLLYPFLFGMVVAVILEPLVSAARRRGLPRGLSAAGLLLALSLGLAAAVGVGLNRLGEELGSLIESGWGDEGLRALESSWVGLAELLRGEPARQGLGTIGGWILAAARSVPGAVVALVIGLLSAYLMLRDKERLLRAGEHLLPRSWRREGLRTGEAIARGFSGIIRAQFLLALVTGALSIAGLSALRVSYAWLLGATAGLLDLVPMVGPFGVFLPAALFLALTGAPDKALAVLGVAGVTLLLRQILEPRFLAAGTGLHPLAMLVAVYAGYRLFGPFGLLVGPLAAAFFVALFRTAVEPFLES
ncbi:MAG: AI-2E family transporter [Chitinophagales bacterium]